jgi:hypothetical protein
MASRNNEHALWGYEPDQSSAHAFWGYEPARSDATAPVGRSRLSTASLVVGIIGTVLVALSALAPWLVVKVIALLPSITLGTLAVVFAAMALSRSRRGRAPSGPARAGLTLGIVDLSLSAIVLVVMLAAMMVQLAGPAAGA